MKSLFSTLATLAFAGVYASNVLDLVPDTFDQHVLSGKPALVEFFAPWCGHCKKLAPIYEELADAFATSKDKVVIAKVDADGDGKPTGQKYGVTGFPTLKWFNGKDPEPETYSGARDFDSLANFITEKSGVKIKGRPPPATIQLDANNFNDIVLDETKDVLVAFTASWCGHCKAMKPTYEKVSVDFLPESNCVVANFEADAEKNVPLSQKYGVQSFPTIKFFSKDDKTPVDYEGERSEEEFVAYLNEKCGTHRAIGGGLDDVVGRIPDLDALASKFFTATAATRSSIYQEALAIADAAGTYGQHYLRVMQKVVNGTDEYLVKESARLKSILEKKSLSSTKLDEIKIKANVLASFAAEKVEEAKVDASEAAESAAKKIKEDL